MAEISEEKMGAIIDRVVARLARHDAAPAPGRATPSYRAPAAHRPTRPVTVRNGAVGSSSRGGDKGVFTSVDVAMQAARAAFVQFCGMGLQARYRVVAAMRAAARGQCEHLAKAAVAETGLGRVDQKVIKNTLVIDKTPGPEILEPWAQSGDHGLTLEEYAPFGVIGAITPTTNPTETIICNGIGMIAAGNAVVFNAHPSARNVSASTVQLLWEAIVKAGGPQDLLTCTADPTIASAQELMRHPVVRLLVVTGGPHVVREAMNAGKKVIAAGPGNPPVVVDETADLEQAALGIVKGVSLDNNIVCTAEKEILAVSATVDRLKLLMVQKGAYAMRPQELSRVEKVVLENGSPNKKWVGKDAAKILREAGVQAPPATLMAFAEVPEDHPFVQREMLMPVCGLVRVADVQQAIAAAVRCEHGNGHTASMYSANIGNLHAMASRINTSIFTKNAPTYAGLGLGGEGYTSFTIASPTGEGLTNARHFSRRRRCTLKDHFRIV